nr:MAG TPA: hypothetical protein [Caudoviricetes sp.]
MAKNLTITVFAKSRKTKDGKSFKTFFTTLPGEDKACKVKFTEAAGNPDCPANIDLKRGDCNLAKENYTDEVTGEVKSVPVLWVSKWAYSAEKYEDHSMDKWF